MLARRGCPPADSDLDNYSRINVKWWQKLECGEVTRREVIVGRFEEFLSSFAPELCAAEVADEYECGLKDCGFLLVDSSFYPDTKEAQYVCLMEIDRVPQELTEETIRSCLDKHLSQLNPSYGEKVRSGLINPVKLIFAQPETYVLYKELMLMKGYSIAQLKPVSVIDNDIQKGFFFTLTEDFEEIKKLSSH